MNRSELVDAIAKKSRLTKKQASDVLSATLSAIGDALKKGQKVVLTGFGTFGVTVRKARTGTNPRTGEKIKIAGRRVPRFKPGKELRLLVSKSK